MQIKSILKSGNSVVNIEGTGLIYGAMYYKLLIKYNILHELNKWLIWVYKTIKMSGNYVKYWLCLKLGRVDFEARYQGDSPSVPGGGNWHTNIIN